MAFIVDDAVWSRLPGMLLVVAAASGLDNRTPRPEVGERLEEAVSNLPAAWGHENAQSHPNIRAWREVFRGFGVSGKKFPSAVEALARRALSGKGIAGINPLVDFYNLVSLLHVVPVGGWDVEALSGGDVHLKLTAGGERFRELGSAETVTAGPGEVSYADGEELITRHFVWRQSEKAKIEEGTRKVFVISEVLGGVGPQVAERVRRSFVEGLERHFAVEPVTAILDSGCNRWDWQGI